jgi:aspartyl-tRNA(Asn)/glutamyl-tRNA(Gln) amidotransferase subunit A
VDKNEMHYATITDIAAALRSREVSSVELTEWLLDRIARLDGDLNAYLTVSDSLALEQAYRADEELAEHIDRGPLHGVPVAVKDLIATRGIRTTAGSRLYEHWVPDEDATVIHKLYEAGAVLLGKTGLHELAFGSTSINPFFGAIANPWRTDHHPGGSSGGSAVAVAAGMAYAAIGTDTGCSVRQPAECCGIVGHKPTFGLVGRSGVLPLIHSMDHVGPLTRNVRDAAIVLQAIVGPDAGDPDSVSAAVPDFTEQLDWSIGGFVVGVPRGFFFDGGDREVVDIVDASLAVFEQLGASLVEIALPNVADAYQAADVTFVEIVEAHAEAIAGNPSAFSEEFKRRYAGVARSTAHEYAEAQKFRRAFKAEVAAVMQRCDVLAMPTSTVAAAPIAWQPPEHATERRKNACIFNFTGQPAISVPCGFTARDLPVGLMLAGRMFEDGRVLQVASAFEQATSWHLRRPPVG